MAYTVIPVPANTWTEIASQSNVLTIFTSGYSKIYAYEGTTIPTDVPNDSDLTQPFAKITNNSTDKEDFIERSYQNTVGETLWLYSVNSATKVILQA